MTGATSTRPWILGASSRMSRPSAVATRSTRRGFQSVPPFATAAIMRAIWSGVTVIRPWPIARLTVSPGCHLSLSVSRFQAGDGTSPGRSPVSPLSVTRPRPNASAIWAIFSGPSFRPSW